MTIGHFNQVVWISQIDCVSTCILNKFFCSRELISDFQVIPKAISSLAGSAHRENEKQYR